MRTEMTCIICPFSCNLIIDGEGDNIIVSGNRCLRGAHYAKSEMTAPKRMLTTTVRITNGALKRLPVRTSNSVPKEKLMELMEIINTLSVVAPVALGDVVVENIAELGVDLVASRSISKIE